MEGLFSDDARIRESAASEYKVFAGKVRIPRKFRTDWQYLLGSRDINDGLEWPEELAKRASKTQWPEYAFGTANAACLLVMHRPGLEKDVKKKEDLTRELFIEPRFPNLGGIPHAHIALFWERHLRHAKPRGKTWRHIQGFLKPAFDGLKNPWSQLMTCNLNPQHGHTGQVDRNANLQGLNILNHVVSLCHPRLILLCGTEVHKATLSWEPPPNTETVKVAHPQVWHSTFKNILNGYETADVVRETLFYS